ncbi:myo-inosose-2 dehydratase [Verminephrobacter eiseniae]|uniref:myo-inosose-2 dehydratase n=2 Tax=Verminephrobacter eiseniae TaxID=364317 RepID=UPI00223773CC|nr:myo-inosose-2 dehydratase [Verminephrobacter eiseniae]MCW5232906.1 myo-inosose-2 dehydratase [Verminephrobacter eiseniae]MCW5261074.1 myo-inosose-2 dehydratase [Verminephrobacter eiseniae]MCW5295540.1 myo-inosose-2 dehydratase [Verminephrobacter eiseniae]MCW8184465.1 myo-inosose-2 dehydratase [Verminephrobacter eiseniae]MCW8232865.1 myo-inosose-2 dehydratase [Verminephrobacter eiseniae]
MSWNVRIGINPLSWSNDDLPSLGGETPLETALREGAEIGYAGFELGYKFPADGPALKARLAEFGLVCVSGWYSGALAEPAPGQSDAQAVAAELERCQPHMRKLQHNDVTVVVYGECAGTIQGRIDMPLAKRPRFADATAWQRYAERLNAFGAQLLARYGIRLAYHHHMGAYVQAPADIDQLMALTDPASVFLLFDTGHAWFGGAADPVALLRKHAARVVHVHCKDVRPQIIDQARNGGWSFLDSVINGAFTVPGDGAIDNRAILRVLKDVGYQGWLVVEAEQDPAVAPSYAYARKGHDTLRALVDQSSVCHGPGQRER